MIEDPDRWAPAYAEAGAAASPSTSRRPRPGPAGPGAAVRGARAGMALKPATPIEPYVDLLPELDMLLLMTVEPASAAGLPRRGAAEDPPGPRGDRRPRPVAAGGRRGERVDHRAVRRGGRRRVRGRLGGLRRAGPGQAVEALRALAARWSSTPDGPERERPGRQIPHVRIQQQRWGGLSSPPSVRCRQNVRSSSAARRVVPPVPRQVAVVRRPAADPRGRTSAGRATPGASR
jgi:hypothetical protein